MLYTRRLRPFTDLPPDMEPEEVPMTRKVNRATVSALERRMCQRLLETRGDPRLRLVLWNGEELRCSDAPPVGRVVLRDRRLIFDLALHPDVGLGNAYASGRLEIEGDLRRRAEAGLMDARRATARSARCASSGRSGAGAAARCARRRRTSTATTTSATTSTSSGSTSGWRTPARTSRRPRRRWRRRSSRRWITSRASCGCVRASAWSRRAAAGARSRCTWRDTTACTSLRTTSRRSRSPGRASAPAREGLSDRVEFRQDDYRNIAGSTTRSSRSACSSTSATRTTRRSAA